MPKAYIREAVYVPEAIVDEEVLQRFSYYIQSDQCRSCNEHFCQACRFRPKEIRSYTYVDGYYGLPWGDRLKINRILGQLKVTVKDLRSRAKMQKPFAFTGQLRPYQKKVAREWLAKRYGIICLPPRSGKTVIAVYLTTVLGLKTLILAHREDLLYQFEEAFHKFSDAGSVARLHGSPAVILLRTQKQHLDKADVVLSTFQYFLRRKDELIHLRKAFGLVIVDECHHVPAPYFSGVVGQLAPRYRLGLSATPYRKDKMEVILYDLLGPVTAKANPPMLTPEVVVIPTNYDPGKFFYWATFMRRLTKNKARNDLILEHLKEDYADGRSILLITTLHDHINTLVRMLTDAKLPFVELHGHVPASKRKKYLDLLRSRQIRITIATREVVKEGIDCPAWDTLYFIIPSANPGGIFQEVSRIRTPDENKKPPLVRYFLDSCKAAIACYQKAKQVMVKNGFKFKGGKDVLTTQSRPLPLERPFAKIPLRQGL